MKSTRPSTLCAIKDCKGRAQREGRAARVSRALTPALPPGWMWPTVTCCCTVIGQLAVARKGDKVLQKPLPGSMAASGVLRLVLTALLAHLSTPLRVAVAFCAFGRRAAVALPHPALLSALRGVAWVWQPVFLLNSSRTGFCEPGGCRRCAPRF